MRTVYYSTAGAVAFLSAIALSYAGCSEPPFLGGVCEKDADCQSDYQTLPGSGCIDGRCGCLDPSEEPCCARGESPPGCFVACRPCSECAVGTEGCPTGCQSDAECPGPPDLRCGEGRCIQGECLIDIRSGPLASQVRGDCQRVECSTVGEVVTTYDPSDYYDDGNQCTSDTCDTSGPRNEQLVNGAACPVSGGRCWGGGCVECWDMDPDNNCPAGYACDGTVCVPGHCTNNQLDSGETDYDCGGVCRPCPPTFTCWTSADCSEGVCAMALCKSPTCTDGVHNDAETGVDCGAPSCPLCGPGQGCETAADCASGVCWAGVCEAPTCYDAVRNGNEAGVDCGPSCGSPCP